MRSISLPISLLLLWMLPACQNGKQGDNQKNETATITSPVTIHRYEHALFSIPPDGIQEGLQALIPAYSLFLGDHLPDEAGMLQLRDYLQDTLIRSLYQATRKTFPSLDSMGADLGLAFGKYQEGFPGPVPKVYSYISGLDYEHPVRYADTVLIIALDMYLGMDHEIYQQAGIPLYRCIAFQPSQLVPECMRQLAYAHMTPPGQQPSLLDWMVFYGKMLYFLDVTLPGTMDYQKFNVTPEQMTWCQKEESKIWGFLISKELLFTTDSKEILKYIPEAPFTKGFPKESPGRVAWFTGWQIVRKYMEKKPETSLKELLKMGDARQILQASGYKPGK